jgi:hypothetical protein
MDTFFEYVYYRIAHALMNWGVSEKYSMHCSDWNVSLCIFANISTIIYIIIYLFTGTISRNTIYGVTIVLGFILMLCLPDYELGKGYGKSFYQQLHKRYKNESHRTLKGWLVYLYVEMSTIIGILITAILLIKSRA